MGCCPWAGHKANRIVQLLDELSAMDDNYGSLKLDRVSFSNVEVKILFYVFQLIARFMYYILYSI